MIIKKLIQTELDIQDCVSLFTDIDANLREILVSTFKGKCYRKCFILDILRLVEYGACVINQSGPADAGTIPVRFEVSAVVYTPGEILNGCVVVNRDESKNIICSYDNTDIIMAPNDMMNSVQVAQKISLRVYQAKYTIGCTRISVSAVPLIPTKTPTLYKFTPTKFSPDFMKYLDFVLDLIDDSRAIAEENSKKSGYKFFETLLYAYSEPQKPANHHTDLLEFVRKPPQEPCLVGRDPRLMPSTDKIFTGDASDIGRDDVKIIMDHPAETVISTLLDEYYNNIKTINEMVKIYNNQAMIDSHRNLWTIYGAAKRAQ